jgi:hypothetical protein
MLWGTSGADLRAADHGDGPTIDFDRAADIGDLYLFTDPADNTKVVLLATFHGFIVPPEAVNFGAFDHNVLCRFEIENTGDAKVDQKIDVTFSPRLAAGQKQTATIRLPNKKTFTADTTPATLNPTPATQAITTDPVSGAQFYAGIVDDPFFFDIPAFSRFVRSVTTGAPNPAEFDRGRDSFAGYNTMAIALSVPASLIRGAATNNIVRAAFTTGRRPQSIQGNGTVKGKGTFKQVDRMGIPGVNVALVPFARKDAYNGAGPTLVAKSKFAGDIVTTLQALGTNPDNIAILAGLAVNTGDFLRLDLTVANTGDGGGNNDGAGFPNGRRLQDDVIDTFLTVVANQTPLGDNVDANDVTFQNAFPFFALPQQPRDAGVIDDNTRN